MKEKESMGMQGFSLDYKNEYKKFKEFYARTSYTGYSANQSFSKSKSLHNHSTALFESSSFNKLIDFSDSQHVVDFYSKAKDDFKIIEGYFNSIKELGKRAKKVTFGDQDKIEAHIAQLVANTSKKINEAELAFKENGMISSIDKSPVVKALITAMQTQLYFSLSKLKQSFKQLSSDVSSIHSQHSAKANSHKSKFDFIVQEENSQVNQTVAFDSHGNTIKMSEISLQEFERPYYQSLNTNIHLVSKTIRELDELSASQGAVIDRIDSNIFNSLERTKKGNKDLFTAREELRKDCGDRLVRTLLLMNIVIFLLLLFKQINF